MAWVYRDADQHKCKLPNPNQPGVKAGDVWHCDGDDGCLSYYIVKMSNDPRERSELYFVALTGDALRDLRSARGF